MPTMSEDLPTVPSDVTHDTIRELESELAGERSA